MTYQQLGKAFGRLLALTLVFADRAQGQRNNGRVPGQSPDRWVAVLEKNLTDHPMIVLWILRLAAELADQPWKRFAEGFLASVVAERRDVLQRLTEELGFAPPVTIVVNPTMRCNLKCVGCYAYEYDRGATMSPELFRKVMTESRELGVRFITLTGGEPFAHPQLLDLVQEFPDIVFMSYTNGTLVTDAVADRIASLGNLLPAFSVEGFEEQTDGRRGKGVHANVLAAMQRLRDRGALFGISVTPTRRTAELLCSDEFIDYYLARGASFVWMFSYLPIGRDPDFDLMPTPKQRDMIRRATLRWRLQRPIFVGDFWNDGACCGGCLAASRYAFVAPDGTVQPCTFVHYHTHNLREHTLREVFASPFFQAIRDCQPYDRNLLRPCMIIDHPQVLRDLVKQYDARPSYPGVQQITDDPAFRRKLDDYAKEYGELAEAAWSNGSYAVGRRALVPFSGYVDINERFADRMARAKSPYVPDKSASTTHYDVPVSRLTKQQRGR